MIVLATFFPAVWPNSKAEDAQRLAREFGFELIRSEHNVNDRCDTMLEFKAVETDPMLLEWFIQGLASYDIRTEVHP